MRLAVSIASAGIARTIAAVSPLPAPASIPFASSLRLDRTVSAAQSSLFVSDGRRRWPTPA